MATPESIAAAVVRHVEAPTLPCPHCGGLARFADAPCARCEDGRVPACAACRAEPVDPLFAPACSGACRDAWSIEQKLEGLRGDAP